MNIEVLLECTVEECPDNIGCMCRATEGVAINHHGVCARAGVLPGFQKTSDTKEESQKPDIQLVQLLCPQCGYGEFIYKHLTEEKFYCINCSDFVEKG